MCAVSSSEENIVTGLFILEIIRIIIAFEK